MASSTRIGCLHHFLRYSLLAFSQPDRRCLHLRRRASPAAQELYVIAEVLSLGPARPSELC